MHQLDDIVIRDVLDNLNRLLKLPIEELISMEYLSLGTLYRDTEVLISIPSETLKYYFWVDEYEFLQCMVIYSPLLKEKVNEINDLFSNKSK